MNRYYAGIGSRTTPAEVRLLMMDVASQLEEEGWTLRSGGANGADESFEAGVLDGANKQIFLPCGEFNGRSPSKFGVIDSSKLPAFEDALRMVSEYHPAPQCLSPFALKLMARNAMQVLGSDLQTPSEFVIAWTPGGKLQGGTAQTLRIAKDKGIPIFNLGSLETLEKFSIWVIQDYKPTFEKFFL